MAGSGGLAPGPGAGRAPSRGAWLLRIGLALGGAFGLFMTAYFLLTVDAEDRRGAVQLAVIGGVLAGVVFGAGMAVVLGLVDRRRRARTGVPFSPSTRAGAEVVVAAAPDQVAPWAWEVLRRLGRDPVWDDATGTMSVSTRVSWWSYGERVSVRLGDGRDARAAPATTWVTVSSRPRLRTQVVDYGSNQVRVRDVVAALQRGPSAAENPPGRR